MSSANVISCTMRLQSMNGFITDYTPLLHVVSGSTVYVIFLASVWNRNSPSQTLCGRTMNNLPLLVCAATFSSVSRVSISELHS